MSYPKTFQHRDNHHAVVTVANAEQEAQLPAEYVQQGGISSGHVGTASTESAMPSIANDELLAAREQLELERVEFAEYMALQQQKLAEDRQNLETERAELTNGFRASVEALQADRAKLDEDQRLFDEAKTASASTSASTASNEAAPAKRVRTPKAE